MTVPKHPRTPHLPNSPGGTNDDKRLSSAAHLINIPVLISEKMDGGNCDYTCQDIFARSHSGPPNHPSFSAGKACHSQIKHLISPDLSVFCEYCYAVHSIEYEELPHHSLVFACRDDVKMEWWDWEMVELQAQIIGFPTVPVLYTGIFSSEKGLLSKVEELAHQESYFGGPREGIVIRKINSFPDSEFSFSVAKWVRQGHVQTDEHWMHQTIKPQKIKCF